MNKFLSIFLLSVALVFAGCHPEPLHPDYASTGKHRGHEYVDLGLSVRWATCNIGAETIVEYGDYFAWGETEPKEIYDSTTYEHYNPDPLLANEDRLMNISRQYDAAAMNWGGMWRMPTDGELLELRNFCKWSVVLLDGVKGYKVVGPNGNAIFLPAAGCMRGSELVYDTDNLYYWSATSYQNTNIAYSLFGVNFGSLLYLDMRYYGLSVRPVCP